MRTSFHTRNLFRHSTALLATVLLPLLLGGWTQGPQSTFDAKGPVAKAQLDVFYTTVWVTGIIFVLVAAVLVYATLKFKARNTDDEHAEPPPQSHGNPLIELSLIAASVAALVIIAVPTLRAIRYSYDVPEEQKNNVYDVTAVGYQWWFRFEYPKEKLDGGAGLVAANELVIPAGRPVRVQLRTADVIHSFWVPKLAGKVDMIPNRGNHLWLQADEPGYFWGQCAEFCGEDHAVMRFRVIALNEQDFAEWLAQQKKPARNVEAPRQVAAEPLRVQQAKYERNAPGWSPDFDANPFENWKQKQFPEKGENPALIAQGRKLFVSKTCAGCHTVRGHEGAGITGPDLTHMGSRTTVAAGLLENNPHNLKRWIADPNGVKPGNKMWVNGYLANKVTLTPEDVEALTAYLASLK